MITSSIATQWITIRSCGLTILSDIYLSYSQFLWAIIRIAA